VAVMQPRGLEAPLDVSDKIPERQGSRARSVSR
jgi:hypothetical protein